MLVVRGVGSWFGKHRLAACIAASIMVLNLACLLPPWQPVFIWQRRAQAAAAVLYGLSVFVFILPGTLLHMAFSAGLATALSYGAHLALASVIGLMAEAAWRSRWWVRVAAAALLVLNAAVFGPFAVTFGDILVGPSKGSCERYVSEQNGIRIVAYPEKGLIPGTHLFLLATRDRGERWRQVLHFRHDDPIDPSCDAIRSLGEDHIWTWIGWKAAVTVDGGLHWDVWTPRKTWPDWAFCNYRLIDDTAFEDAVHGRMSLNPVQGRVPSDELETTDGGKTWRPVPAIPVSTGERPAA